MATPSLLSSVITDANVFRVGSARLPNTDISATAILKKWPLSDDTMVGWSAGPTLQLLQLSPAQMSDASTFVPTLGVRTHGALAHRFSPHIKLFVSIGVGAHVASVVTEGEGIGHLGVMFPRLFGLPDSVTPLIQGIGGIGVFHPQNGPLRYAAIYGGGIGMRCQF